MNLLKKIFQLLGSNEPTKAPDQPQITVSISEQIEEKQRLYCYHMEKNQHQIRIMCNKTLSGFDIEEILTRLGTIIILQEKNNQLRIKLALLDDLKHLEETYSKN